MFSENNSKNLHTKIPHLIESAICLLSTVLDKRETESIIVAYEENNNKEHIYTYYLYAVLRRTLLDLNKYNNKELRINNKTNLSTC